MVSGSLGVQQGGNLQYLWRSGTEHRKAARGLMTTQRAPAAPRVTASKVRQANATAHTDTPTGTDIPGGGAHLGDDEGLAEADGELEGRAEPLVRQRRHLHRRVLRPEVGPEAEERRGWAVRRGEDGVGGGGKL